MFKLLIKSYRCTRSDWRPRKVYRNTPSSNTHVYAQCIYLIGIGIGLEQWNNRIKLKRFVRRTYYDSKEEVVRLLFSGSGGEVALCLCKLFLLAFVYVEVCSRLKARLLQITPKHVHAHVLLPCEYQWGNRNMCECARTGNNWLIKNTSLPLITLTSSSATMLQVFTSC